MIRKKPCHRCDRPPPAMAREQIEAELHRHQGAMWKLAYRFFKRHPNSGDADDYFQQAQLGLLHAAERFDPSRGIKFLTYSYYWMRNYCQQLAFTGGVIRTPRILSAPDPVVRQWPLQPDDLGNWVDMPWPEREWRSQDMAIPTQIRLCLDRLTPRQRSVIEMRHGLGGGPAMTLAEVGKELGLTRERVRQIQMIALQILREELVAASV